VSAQKRQCRRAVAPILFAKETAKKDFRLHPSRGFTFRENRVYTSVALEGTGYLGNIAAN